MSGIMRNLSIATAVTGFLAVIMITCQIAHGNQDQALVDAARNSDLQRGTATSGTGS